MSCPLAHRSAPPRHPARGQRSRGDNAAERPERLAATLANQCSAATRSDLPMHQPLGGGVTSSVLAVSAPLLAVHLFSASVWVGGLVALVVLNRAAREMLDPPTRAGSSARSVGATGWSAALLIAIATDGILLHGQPWTAALRVLAALTAALVLIIVLAVVVARRINRLRARQHMLGLSEPASIRSQARKAAAASDDRALADLDHRRRLRLSRQQMTRPLTTIAIGPRRAPVQYLVFGTRPSVPSPRAVSRRPLTLKPVSRQAAHA